MSNSGMQAIPAPGQTIPIPENFPVSWEDPHDARLTWQLDNHVTHPLAPLSYSVSTAVLRGFPTAFAQFGLPIHMHLRLINGYPYAAMTPISAPPEVLMKAVGVVNRFAPGLVGLLTGRMTAQMSKQQMDKINPILERADTYWKDELLPEINQHFAYFESCDLRGLNLAQLRLHFTESLKRIEKLGELHARAGFSCPIAMSMFEELYLELFPDATSLDALRLLQGFESQTLAGDRMLWQLSRVALATPAVYQALTGYPASEFIPVLEQSAQGRHFLANFRTYLNQYGQRLNAFGQLTESSWIEEPAPAIECLKAYITRLDANPESEQTWLVAGREQAVAEARTKLKGYPQPVLARFETLLKAAQMGARIKEDNHWVIERVFYHMRQLALEFGRRLATAGNLETEEDVFYLTADELLAGSLDAGFLPGWEPLRQRKAEREYFSRITPPHMLGTMPPFMPDGNNPFTQSMKKADFAVHFGNSETNGLQGLSGSPGVVRGPARIIHTLGEASKLQKGDILVTQATMPPWTPLFAIAAAVVTDYGGVLSHCAIVAREYHIPAVVGTGRATQTFNDGQILEVDGDAGIVRLVDVEILEVNHG